jgi:hypothetical protein
MIIWILVFMICAIIPILVYVGIGHFIADIKVSQYDFVLPPAITCLYLLMTNVIFNRPRSFGNLSIDVSLILLSLIIYGLNMLIKNNKFIAKAFFSVIPISTMFFVLFFVEFVYE